MPETAIVEKCVSAQELQYAIVCTNHEVLTHGYVTCTLKLCLLYGTHSVPWACHADMSVEISIDAETGGTVSG